MSEGISGIWHLGPPPFGGDGSLCIVILKPESEMIAPLEHYGQPVIVCRWETKLKTTVHPTRIEYEDVIRWAECPEWMRR